MFQEVMSLALGNGLWAALFCLLFLYQLRDSRAREKKYSSAVESLTDSLKCVKGIKADCLDISAAMGGLGKDCRVIRSDCAVIKSGVKSLKAGMRIKKDDAVCSASLKEEA